MANSGGGQFSEDAQFPDRFAQPGPGRKRPMPQFGGDADFDPGFQKRGRFDGPEEEPSVPPATLRILVRQHDAGGIIGKGGENIKRLRKLHDCQVVLPDSPGAPERVMTIMGRVEGCIGVLKDTLPKLGDGPVTEKGGNELAYEVQVLIPQPFMGTIIGTGGTKIKELRSKTRTSIKIFSEPMPNSNERSVQLIGTEVQIVECIEYFLDEISKKEPREPIFLYEPTAEGDMFPGPGGPPPGGDFPPHRGGHNFRGGRDGGRQGFRGGGRGRNGSDRGRGRGGGGSFQRSWKSDQDRGPGGGAPPPPFQPPPPPNPAPPVMGGSGYNPPSHLPAANTSYGQANVGYSSMPPSSLPPPTSGTSSMGQGGVPPMYMPPAAPAAPSVPLPSIPPPGQQTQQVTIPNEYAMSILGVNGGNLEHIKNQSSCEIVINDPKPGSTERIINITGNPASIQLAQTLMQNSVRQYHSV